LQIIGEAMLMLEKLAPQYADQVSDSKRIIRFRHVLAHGYDVMHRDVEWNIIENKLPTLQREVDTLLNRKRNIQ